MNKELDLVKILEKVPKGTKLYSLTDGEVTLNFIANNKCFSICVTDIYGNDHCFTKEGKYRNLSVGECILFPSKDCRDWSKFKVDLPKGTPVMVKDNNSDWKNVPDSLINKAIKAVEDATGLSFGDESAEETITSVCNLDGEAILEW